MPRLGREECVSWPDSPNGCQLGEARAPGLEGGRLGGGVQAWTTWCVSGVPSWPLLFLALSREVGPAGPWDRVGGPEPAAPGQRSLEARPYFQRLPCLGSGGRSLSRSLGPRRRFLLPLMWGCGALLTEPVQKLSRTGSGRRAKLDWKSLPTALGSRKGTDSARGRGLASPAQLPRGARRDGALPWRREPAAPPRPTPPPSAASEPRGSRPLPALPGPPDRAC